MRRIRFHYYVSGSYDGWISRAIGGLGWMAHRKRILQYFGQRLLVSHKEVEFVDRNILLSGYIYVHRRGDELGLVDGRGVCFSSATRGDFIGVRFAPTNEVLKNLDRWITVEVEVPDSIEQTMFEKARSVEGRKYDYIGVLFKITPFDSVEAWWRWYCTEVIDWICAETGWQGWLGGIYRKHRKLSPVADLLMVLDAGYKIKTGD